MNHMITVESAMSTVKYVSIDDGETQSTSNWLNVHDEYLVVNHPGHNHLLCTRPEWIDKEYRQAYMEVAIEQGVAWQIKANRELRGWSQDALAKKLETQQSAISRLEDPSYGRYSLDMLTRVAHAFDCALLVKLVPYSTLAREAQRLSPEDLYAAGYQSEYAEGNHEL